MTNKEMEVYDYIVETELVTTEELNLARNLVDGSWEEVLNRVIYIRTGYRTFDQWLMEFENDEE